MRSNKCFNDKLVKRILAICFCINLSFTLSAQSNELIPTGSYIINMGVVPQTTGNALKPYGLVITLIDQYNVPIKWVINAGKTKDGVDFTYNGNDYKGGPFIISEEHLSASVLAEIALWEAKGVVGVTTSSEVTVPVYQTISHLFEWTLDAANGSIAEGYITNAEIPSSFYNWTTPSNLDCCNDLYVMPHADPTWSSHNNLYSWVQSYASGGCNGSIWAACHAVSALENVYNPSDTTQQMNFLSHKNGNPPAAGDYADNSLILDGDHGDGTPAYTYQNHSHPVMQFLGDIDDATLNGSEQVYLPTNDWRGTTYVGAHDPDHPEIVDGEAGVMVFGSAFGDADNGNVMYEAGHTHDGTAADNIAAQRAFFNFSIWSTIGKAVVVSSNVPAVLEGGETYNLTANVSGGSGSSYTYAWTASCPGTFSDTSVANPTFTPNSVAILSTCIITCEVEDACGRTTFSSNTVAIQATPTPPVAENDTVNTFPEIPVDINAIANDYDVNQDPLTLVFLTSAVTPNGTFTNNNDGTVSYVSNSGYLGLDSIQYEVCDTTPIAKGGPLCDTAWVFVSVANQDVNGCLQNEYFANYNVFASGVESSTIGNSTNSTGTPDAVYTDVFDQSDELDLIMSSSIPSGSSVTINGLTDNFFGDVSISSNNVSYNQIADEVSFPYSFTSAADFLYLRVGASENPGKGDEFSIDAVSANVQVCQSAEPVAVNDTSSTLMNLAINYTVQVNDTDPQGNTLVTSLVTNSLNGSAIIESDGSITYYPDMNFTGQDSVQYSICNTYNGGLCDTAWYFITIDPGPCAAGEVVSGSIDTVYAVSVESSSGMGNESNALGVPDAIYTDKFGENDQLDLIMGQNVLSGSSITLEGLTNNYQADISISSDNVTYTPVADEISFPHTFTAGSDFLYARISADGGPGKGNEFNFDGLSAIVDNRVCNTPYINAVNDSDTTDFGTPVVINVASNDSGMSSPDPSTINFIGQAAPEYGFINLDTLTGLITYTPYTGFSGTDAFDYQICNSFGLCDVARVTVLVNPGTLDNTTKAGNDYTNTPYNVPVTSNVLTNDWDYEEDNQLVNSFTIDSDGDGIPETSKSLSASTVVGGVNEDGSVNTNAGSLTLNADGSYTFVPTNGFTGSVFYDYEVCDDGVPIACKAVKGEIEVLKEMNTANTDVTASPDFSTTEVGVTITNNLLTNDYDPENGGMMVSSSDIDTDGDGIADSAMTLGSTMTVAGVDEDGNAVLNAGLLTINATGTYTFVPANGFIGTVTAEYGITDDDGDTDIATLEIVVTDYYGNAIFPTDDSAVTDAATPVSKNIKDNDHDPENDGMIITGILVDSDGDGLTDSDQSSKIDGSTEITVAGTDTIGNPVVNAGTLVLADDGTYTFLPSDGFAGNVNVVYTVCDAAAPPACDQATLEITVLDVKRDYGDAPAIYPDAWHRSIKDSNSNNVLDGASDVWLGTNTNFETSQLNDLGALGDSYDDAISQGNNSGQFPTIINASTTYEIDVTVNSSQPSTVYYGMWIDWNNDGSYDDFYNGSQVTASPAIAKVSITSPASYSNAPINIRLRVDDMAFASTDFSGGRTNGEVEDYQFAEALPVDLQSFSGDPSECGAILFWSSASEEGFKHYEITRSKDGVNFETLAQIAGTGSVNGDHYQYKDEDHLMGSVYYRLKMVDLDGQFEYSKIIEVLTDCGRAPSETYIYPNPLGNHNGYQLNVRFYSLDHKTDWVLLNNLGQVLRQFSFVTIPASWNIVQLDTSNLPSGNYYLKRMVANREENFSISIQQ